MICALPIWSRNMADHTVDLRYLVLHPVVDQEHSCTDEELSARPGTDFARGNVETAPSSNQGLYSGARIVGGSAQILMCWACEECSSFATQRF